MGTPLPLSSVGSFFDSVGEFFSNLARVEWPMLILGLTFFGIYLALRSRAWFNILRAAYPDEPFEWRRVWGAYMAAYGFNNVVLARGGDVMKLFLVKTSIPKSSYPALGSSMLVESIYDLTIAIPVLTFAFTQGVFPKPPDFSSLNAFDLSFFASHPKGTLFGLTVLGVLTFVGFAVLSAAEAAARGGTQDEVYAAAVGTAERTTTLFYVDTLEHLRRGGRIGAAQALLGTALSVKPILHVEDGRIVPLEKVRTVSKGIARLEALAVAAAGDGPADVAVHHLAAAERAGVLADRLRSRLPRIERFYTSEIGAVVGAHVGPGVLGVVVVRH